MKPIAIDTGNSQIKTCHNVFTSGLKVFQKKPSSGEYVKWNDKFFVLSNERITYQEDKTKSDDFKVLTLFAIAKEIKAKEYEPGMEIALAVGLPPEHMMDAAKKNAWGTYFTSSGRKITFEYNDKEYTIFIKKVFVYPQGYAAVFLNPELYEKLTVSYIVDIGGYTMDVLKLNSMEPDPSLRRSLNLGLITFYNKAIHQVKVDTDCNVNEDDVIAFLKTGRNNRKDITESFNIALDEYCRTAQDKLSELGIDIRHHNVTFIGGGAAFLKDNLQKLSEGNPGLTFEEDVKVNARGYQKILEMKLKQLRG